MAKKTSIVTVSKFPSVAVIVTLLNEVDFIDELLIALSNQTMVPTEVCITDGGSTDGSWQKLQRSTKKKYPFLLRCKQVIGNRSVGRNTAVTLCLTKLIACTDAGCIPKPNWLEELLKEQSASQSKVVAGYYEGAFENTFEQAQIPYVLVMSDKVDPSSFLPATRSMLFEKKWFVSTEGFDEILSDNEDYAFARKIVVFQKETGKRILSFTNKAVVTWRPRKTLKAFMWMLFRFARGDVRAKLWRPKVFLIFFRYAVFFSLLIFAFLQNSQTSWLLILLGIVVYLGWSIAKNYRYAKPAWNWLPVLQVASDIAVMFGTIMGLAQAYREEVCRLEKRVKKKNQ